MRLFNYLTQYYYIIILTYSIGYYLFSHKSLTKFTQKIDNIYQNLSITILTLQTLTFQAKIDVFFEYCINYRRQWDKQQDAQNSKQCTAHRDRQQYPNGGKSGSFPGDLRIDEIVFDLADDVENQQEPQSLPWIDHQDQ